MLEPTQDLPPLFDKLSYLLIINHNAGYIAVSLCKRSVVQEAFEVLALATWSFQT